MRRFWSHALPGFLLLVCCCGCIRVDYVGQSYPERRHGAVVFYPRRKQVPRGEYRIMGRIELKAINGTDGYDIQDKLIAEANRRGADAVVLVSSKKVRVGMLPNSVGRPIVAAAPQNVANIALNGAPIEQDTFGKVKTIGGNVETRFEIHVRALLLIHKEAYEAIRDNHLEDADPVIVREDPSGQPFTLPPVSPDLEEKTVADALKTAEKPAPEKPPKETPDDQNLFRQVKGPMTLPQQDPDLKKITPAPTAKPSPIPE